MTWRFFPCPYVITSPAISARIVPGRELPPPRPPPSIHEIPISTKENWVLGHDIITPPLSTLGPHIISTLNFY